MPEQIEITVRKQLVAWVRERIPQLLNEGKGFDINELVAEGRLSFQQDRLFVSVWMAQTFDPYFHDLIRKTIQSDRATARAVAKLTEQEVARSKTDPDQIADKWLEKTNRGFVRLMDLTKADLVARSMEYDDRAHPLLRRAALYRELAQGMQDGQHVRDVYDVNTIGDIEAKLQLRWSYGLLGEINAQAAD